MAEDTGAPKKKGFLRKTFHGAAHVLKELTVHSLIHFTLWGAIFASNFALFLAPVTDPLGKVLTAGAESLGLGHWFTQAAGGGAASLTANPALNNVPVLGG